MLPALASRIEGVMLHSYDEETYRKGSDASLHDLSQPTLIDVRPPSCGGDTHTAMLELTISATVYVSFSPMMHNIPRAKFIPSKEMRIPPDVGLDTGSTDASDNCSTTVKTCSL